MSNGSVIIAAGVAGVLVVVVAVWHERILRALTWPRRYLRARGYEHELARHTAAGLRAELDAGTYGAVTYGFVDYATTRSGPPWPLEPRWQSDMEAAGEPLPDWARPDGDRSSAFGLVSGSSGSDYHGGELPTAGEGGRTPPAATGRPGSEPYGVTGPATRPFGDVPEDPALDETWARLELAWALESAALPSPVAVAPPAPGSRLATRFDVELAAECARFIRDQNRDVTGYLERLLGVRR